LILGVHFIYKAFKSFNLMPFITLAL